MFEKIIKKLQFGYCKTKTAEDKNSLIESEKTKQEDTKK